MKKSYALGLLAILSLTGSAQSLCANDSTESSEDTSTQETLTQERVLIESPYDYDLIPEDSVSHDTDDYCVPEDTAGESTIDAVVEDTTFDVVITPASDEQTTDENTVDAVDESTVAEQTIDDGINPEATIPEDTVDAVAEDTDAENTIDAVAEETADIVNTPEVPEDTTDGYTILVTGTVTVNNITSNDTIDPDEVSGTIAVTGTASGVDIHAGDAVNMAINEVVYTTTVGSDGTWSVDVSSNDLIQDREFIVNVISTYNAMSITSSAVSTHKVSLSTELQAHYEFEGNINDSSGNNRNLSIIGGGTANYIAGKIGNAYYFNDTNNSLRTSALTSSTDGTFSFWINTNLTTLQNIIRSKSALGTNDGAGLFVNTDGTMNIGTTNDTTTYTYTPVGIQDGNWHHVVLTFGSVLTPILYVDGVSIAFDTSLAGTLGLKSILDIGNNEGYHLTGYMDDVRIYNRALTASDVTELCYTNILHANFTFDGNTTLLNNSSIDAYLTKQDATTSDFLRNLPNSVSTTSSTSSYDYNSTFPDLDENQTLTIRLSLPMSDIMNGVSAFGMTVLHTELNAANNLNLTKAFTLSSLNIFVQDIANMREIVFLTSDGNFSGNIIFENNNAHINRYYYMPIINGDYTIAASYRDGNISYYDSSTNSWGGNTPTIVNITADKVLAPLPSAMSSSTPCAWVGSGEFRVCMPIMQTLTLPITARPMAAIAVEESHVFKFTLSSAQNIAILTRDANGSVSYGTDTYGALYDSTGYLIAENDDASNNDYNFKILTNLQAGTYTLVVGGSGWGAVPEYQLNILNNYNPKIAKHLNYGYTYVSLPSSKTLCAADVQNKYLYCDQDNTLESVFGTNMVFKFGREWMYWDNNATANPAYSMQKFSTINPLEGIMVKTSAETNVSLPFDENSEAVNDYTNLFPEGWTLMSNNQVQTVAQIETALAAPAAGNKVLVYILLLRDNLWHVYPSSAAVSPSLPMDSNSSVNRHESYWVYFR